MEATTGDANESNSGNKDACLDNESASLLGTKKDSLYSGVSSSFAKGVTKADEVRKSSISELVGKSKKAAFSLWTLLHAKNCRLGVDRCSHPGCSEAKLMYLHHKTCSARLLEPCPSQYKGCQDARKLLAHYRRCRDIRARQSQNPSSARKPQQHVCLVCSLVARHAKFTLDRNSSHASRNGTTSHYIPSLNLSHDSYDGIRRSQSLSSATYSSLSQDSSQQPRFAFSRRPKDSGDVGTSGLQALQAAVSCALNSNNSSDSLSSSLKTVSYDHSNENKILGRQNFDENCYNRPRAGSLDVRRSQSIASSERQQRQEKNMSYLYLAAVDNFSDSNICETIPENNHSTNNARRRSLSCTVPSNSNQSATGRGNGMLENSPIAEDLQYILGGGS